MSPTTDRATAARPLRLAPMAGPEIEPIVFNPEATVRLGRSSDCEVELPDAAVSRCHASIGCQGGRWFISDLDSRHGTFLNTVKLQPHQRAEISEGDLLRITPWLFRATFSAGDSQAVTHTTDDAAMPAALRVQRVRSEDLSRLAQHRLELLLEYAGTINTAEDEQTLADAVLTAALAGTSFGRAALLRRMGGAAEVEVIGYRERGAERSSGPVKPQNITFSRTLVREAEAGEIVQLSSGDVPMGQSIMQLQIADAICAPVMIGGVVAAFLYLDARGESTDRSSARDAAGFCQAVARLSGLSLANLKRLELMRRQRRLDTELNTAREAQRLILPPERGAVGAVGYALTLRPGSFVAGDLFDALALPDGRAAVSIGDVSGEGIGASVLMSATQAYLHGALLQHSEPADAVNSVNRYIARRSAMNRFVTLWVGIISADGTRLDFVDAGHGHWLHKPVNAEPRAIRARGGLPMGIDAEFIYATERLDIQPGDRIILYSDGVTEQPSPEGDQFGSARLIEIIRDSPSESEDVLRVLLAVQEHAKSSELADDTTVASFVIRAAGGGEAARPSRSP